MNIYKGPAHTANSTNKTLLDNFSLCSFVILHEWLMKQLNRKMFRNANFSKYGVLRNAVHDGF